MKLTCIEKYKCLMSIFFTLSFPGILLANSIDPNAFYVDKDHANASNSNSGTAEAPWKTIQHAVNQLQPGNRLYVRASVEPYFEPYRKGGSNWGGITIDVSGTETQPIYIEGYPGERPVIDQQLRNSYLRAEDGSPDQASKTLSGFFLYRAHNIVIKNFEIRNCNSSGVMFDHSLHNNNIVIENMHIHHLYGGDNIGGIRVDHGDNVIVRNSLIHDTYDTRHQTGNPFTSEPYAMHSGIHGYKPGNGLIENNVIFNVAKGVYSKASDPDLKDSHTVRRNVFYNIQDAAFFLGVSGVGTAPALNAKFYENIVYNASRGVNSKLYETSDQSSGMLIYNNTFYNVDEVVNLRGQIGIEIYNNIIYDANVVNLAIENSSGYGNINEVGYVGNNLYFNHAGQWLVERSSPDLQKWTSLDAWKVAFSQDSGTSLTQDPGVGSFEADPLFENIGNNKDFKLKSGSPALGEGRFGEDIGAYSRNTVVIGRLSNMARPSPPQIISIE